MNILRYAILALPICGALGATNTARAQQVNFQFCFEYLTNYTDAATGLFSDGDYPARNATMRIVRNSNSDQFDFTLGQDGCLSVNLMPEPWTIRLLRTANVGGNTVEVRQDSTNILYSSTVETAFTPSNGGSQTWSVGPTDAGNIMAAATYAMFNRNGGITGETWSFRDGITNCGAGAGGCWNNSSRTINISTGAGGLAKYKFGIVHELGHAMSDAANNYQGFAQSYQAALDACVGGDAAPPNSSHRFSSKEYNSGAAVEAFAHFMSAVTFNSSGGAGTACTIEKHYIPDWDQSGGVSAGESAIFSCEAGISGTTPVIDGADYLGDFCVATGQVNNRGTEYDWLRMFWDLNTDEGILWQDLLAQWNAANPHNWNATGNGTGGAYPSARMESALNNGAAPPLNYLSAYQTWAAFNGTDR